MSTLQNFIVILFSLTLIKSEEPKVIINSTTFLGTTLKTWKGNNFYAFRGIRFAQPPVDDLRFRDPQQLEINLNNKTYDATKDRNDCPSIYSTNPSEDCLFLNVYTKYIDDENLKPVLIFIHPGGLYVGSSLSSFIGPEYLMEKDIVVVTFNYRLGTLGFPNFGTKDYPGNAGLKDQVFALRWVQKNIESFGGNKNHVTLIGYSAGGVSVQLHLVSSLSIGLFHRAIIMSGTIQPQLQIPEGDQINLMQRQAKLLGCNGNNIEMFINCLKSKNYMDIAGSLRKMFYFGKDNPIYLWLPVIEKDFGQERFLIENPYTSLKNGEFQKVPVMIGFTENEFCTSAKDILFTTQYYDEFNDFFNTIYPICFAYDHYINKTDITRQLQTEYFQRRSKIDRTDYNELCSLFSDTLIKFGTSYLTELISKFVPIYRYEFTYVGRFSNLYYNESNAKQGAEHMDDLMYLFKISLANFSPDDPEAELVELMTKLVTNFATGNYSEMEKWEYKTGNYAEITDVIQIKNSSFFKKNEFFKNIFLQ